MRTQILSKLKYFTQKLLTYLFHIVALEFLDHCVKYSNILEYIAVIKDIKNIKIISRQVKTLMMHVFLTSSSPFLFLFFSTKNFYH